MYYDLDSLEKLSNKLGFAASRISPDTLEISVKDNVILVFMNLFDEKDTLIGFKGTPWHAHGKVMLMRDEESYVTLDEQDVLQGIKTGDILIVEQYRDTILADRWLAHQEEKIDVRFTQPGEEIRICKGKFSRGKE